MRQKLKYFTAQTMLFLFLSAFVTRPVLVTVENSYSNWRAYSTQTSVRASHQSLESERVSLRPVCRETSQIPTLSPCFQKTILASSEGRALAFVSPAVNSSPQSFLILRI